VIRGRGALSALAISLSLTFVWASCGSKSGLLPADSRELDASSAPSPPTDTQCARSDFRSGYQDVSLYVLLDRSGSMKDDDKWAQATAALAAFVHDPSAAGIGVGLQYFPLNSSCDEAQYGKPAVPIGLLPQNADAIISSLSKQSPDGETPTLPALRRAIEYARAQLMADATRAVYIALVTDGAPNACNSTAQSVAFVAEQGATAEPQVLTFAIGLSMGFVGDLELIAAKGGTGKPILVGGHNPAQALIDALRALRDTQKLCRFPLPSTSSSPAVSDLSVAYRNSPDAALTLVPRVAQAACGVGAGFFVEDTDAITHVQLCPALCELLHSTPSSSVTVLVGCAGNLDAGPQTQLPEAGTCSAAVDFGCVAFCGSKQIVWPVCLDGQWQCPAGHVNNQLCYSCPVVPHACCRPDGTLETAVCIDGAWQCAPGGVLYGEPGCQAPYVCSDDLPCAMDQWCDTPNDLCGAELRAGSCKPRLGCSPGGPPVCGCNGVTYDDACAAQASGVDLWANGPCAAPPGTFACGGYFCTNGQVCRKTTLYEGPEPLVSHACIVPPSGCSSGCGCQLCEACPPGKSCTESCAFGQLDCIAL
jgi:hypothetical protein